MWRPSQFANTEAALVLQKFFEVDDYEQLVNDFEGNEELGDVLSRLAMNRYEGGSGTDMTEGIEPHPDYLGLDMGWDTQDVQEFLEAHGVDSSNRPTADIYVTALLYGFAKWDLFPNATFGEPRVFAEGFEYDYSGISESEW